MTRYTVRIYRYGNCSPVYTSEEAILAELPVLQSSNHLLVPSVFYLVLYSDAAARARVFRIIAGEEVLQASAERALLDPLYRFWQSVLSVFDTVSMLISCEIERSKHLT